MERDTYLVLVKLRTIFRWSDLMSRKIYINILTILFLTIIFNQYNYLDGIYKVCSILILIYVYFFKHKKYQIQIVENKVIYIIYISISMILSLIIGYKNKVAISYFINLAILTMILVRILQVYGNDYFNQFFINFIRIMLIFNIISIIELTLNTNFWVNFLPEYDRVNFIGIGREGFRIFSTFRHPIVYGNILVITIGIIITFRMYFNKVYYYINIVLCLVNLYGTRSRSSWIAFVVLILFLLIIKIKQCTRMKKKKLLLGSMTVILISIIMIGIFGNEVLQILQTIIDRFSFSDNNIESKTQRIGAIKNILNSFNHNILSLFIGNGMRTTGKFMIENQVLLDGFMSVDNQYITMLYDMGIVFLIVVILYIVNSIFSIFTYMCSKDRLPILIIVITSVNMFFYEALFWDSIIFIVMISIILNCTIMKEVQYNN